MLDFNTNLYFHKKNVLKHIFSLNQYVAVQTDFEIILQKVSGFI